MLIFRMLHIIEFLFTFSLASASALSKCECVFDIRITVFLQIGKITAVPNESPSIMDIPRLVPPRTTKVELIPDVSALQDIDHHVKKVNRVSTKAK